jgi:hypothetical protein
VADTSVHPVPGALGLLMRGLTRRTGVVRLLGLRVRIPPAAWMPLLSAVRERSVRRAHHPSRGVLPSVVCLSVIVKPR